MRDSTNEKPLKIFERAAIDFKALLLPILVAGVCGYVTYRCCLTYPTDDKYHQFRDVEGILACGLLTLLFILSVLAQIIGSIIGKPRLLVYTNRLVVQSILRDRVVPFDRLGPFAPQKKWIVTDILDADSAVGMSGKKEKLMITFLQALKTDAQGLCDTLNRRIADARHIDEACFQAEVAIKTRAASADDAYEKQRIAALKQQVRFKMLTFLGAALTTFVVLEFLVAYDRSLLQPYAKQMPIICVMPTTIAVLIAHLIAKKKYPLPVKKPNSP